MAVPWLVPPLAKSTKEVYEMQQKSLLLLLSRFWCTVCHLVGTLLTTSPLYSSAPLLLWSPVNLLVSVPTCLQAQLWLQWLCLPSWLSPCLALTSVCQVCSSSSLTTNFRESLYQPIWLVHPLPPTCSDFPSPGFRPSKGPSADSSSAHTSWIAASGLAPIPAIDYCNVLGRITCNVKIRLWHIHLGCIKMNSHNTFLLKHAIKWFH